MTEAVIEKKNSSNYHNLSPLAFFRCNPEKLSIGTTGWQELIHDYQTPLFLTQYQDKPALVPAESVSASLSSEKDDDSLPLLSIIPVISPEKLGNQQFKNLHRVKYCFIAGAMANGITSEELVIAMANADMLAFFGAGGLSMERIEKAIDRIQAAVGQKSYGFNLLHNPFEPDLEQATVEMYLKKGVKRVSAAAYLRLTLPVVQYRVSGLKKDETGKIIPKNHIFAKISRTEVARAFMSPPPDTMLTKLLELGKISREEAQLARHIPMAEDITAEADSGGHTDRRPFTTLIPTILGLRNQIQQEHRFERELRVGAAGGISTPAAVAAAFNMGAAYVLTGTINQLTREAGTSMQVRQMLSKAEPHDVTMAPAADMFEMGVKLQVLKFGTMFPIRAEKLYSLYQTYDNLESIPEKDRLQLEKQIFKKSLDEIWDETQKFFQKRDPTQLKKATTNPKHKMALVFRWYLGKSSRWAIEGDESRKMDYQVWCGPAIGSFNGWRKGSFLEKMDNIGVVTVSLNMLRGAAILCRVHFVKCLGLDLPPKALFIPPIPG
ncbi:PfaD family polyunsaturated fatty acid/polyketide biosynthesis protein [Candidatus Riflebacteria bacterium]